MTYPQAITYLESFINYEEIPAYPYKKSLKLERIKDFLVILGNPQDALRCIHVAGTKGKGSTCAFIAYILREAGYKVGLYTSPHLSDFRERIRVVKPSRQAVKKDFEGMISCRELTRLAEKLKPFIERFNRRSRYGPLSFFEVYTSLAFVYFKEKKVDFAVLETGLGGRLDATNVVNPLVSVITPISYEHTQKLGNTLREIAGEKAGIIKRQKAISKRQKLPVISAPQEKEAEEVIRKKCKDANAILYEVGRDIPYEKKSHQFRVKGLFGTYSNLKIRLLGRHQLINAATAIETIEALSFHNINVDIGSIRRGLHRTVWPGRCEVISRKPLVVLDGAQNVASAKALKKTIIENFSAKGGSASGGKYKRLILILGISNDKDINGICSQLCDLADIVVLTKANNPRASLPQDLVQYFLGKEVHITYNIKEAKSKAYFIVKKRDLILVCGSLFVVGEFRDETIQP